MANGISDADKAATDPWCHVRNLNEERPYGGARTNLPWLAKVALISQTLKRSYWANQWVLRTKPSPTHWKVFDWF
jgi:hypothetical protein